LVLPRFRTAVFVHGCFWHQHPNCRFATRPGTNIEFWQAKFAGTRERDLRTEVELKALGWHVEVVWECEDTDRLNRLVETLLATAVARR
jgi:DNA mismatch endonuclease, patch repair protein